MTSRLVGSPCGNDGAATLRDVAVSDHFAAVRTALSHNFAAVVVANRYLLVVVAVVAVVVVVVFVVDGEDVEDILELVTRARARFFSR